MRHNRNGLVNKTWIKEVAEVNFRGKSDLSLFLILAISSATTEEGSLSSRTNCPFIRSQTTLKYRVVGNI